jgi:hypothetical protein
MKHRLHPVLIAVRSWLIKKLAGKMCVLVNVTISGGEIILTGEDTSLIFNVSVYDVPADRVAFRIIQ